MNGLNRLGTQLQIRPPFSQACAMAVIAFSLLIPGLATAQVSQIKPDQEILFFTSIGFASPEGGDWELMIHGSVYEPERRRLAVALIRETLDLKHAKLSNTEDALVAERARLFMVDNKGGRRIVVRIGTKTFELHKSGSDGQFWGTIRLPKTELQGLAQQKVPVEAVLPRGDTRRFAGEIELVGDTGLTVISDIDDTIKITRSWDRKAMLRSTFLEPFEPVPGMADLYSSWAKERGAKFFYVSASPWQLFAPLSAFVQSNGFPAGAFSLKKVRLKDRSILTLFAGPEEFKLGAIEPLLQQFPRRSFVLVGDSGQRDPETYGALARKYPNQIRRIFIRDVTDEPADSCRYQEAFRDLAPGLWQIFRDPAKIRRDVPD